MEFSIQAATTGKQLFEQVIKTIGLRELWYFGLNYTDNTGHEAWLKLNKKVKDQDLPKDHDKLEFSFRAKFYPEDATDELIQDITVHLFFLQVKEAILNDSIYCPPEAAVLLASYAMQAKFGDHQDRHVEDIQKDIEQGKVLPRRVKELHPNFTSEDWAKKISEWHAEHKGLLREDTMKEYLKIAQDLDMYGVSYFGIKNKKGTDLLLGVDALGINVYEKDNKLTPRIGFPWSEISNISFSGRNFTIKPLDKKSPDFVLRVDKPKTNKAILAICMGNHELYLRRRKPDTIEVQQMKAEAKAAADKRQAERERQERERRQLEQAEQRAKELEERLKLAEQEAQERERKLKESEEENMNLRNKLGSIQADIEKMERERNELLEEKESLAQKVSEGEMTKEEYERRMLEIQEEYKEVQERLDNKEAEAEDLKQNLTLTQAEKEAELQRVQAEMERKLLEEQEAKLALEMQANQISDENRKLLVQKEMAETLQKQQLEQHELQMQQQAALLEANRNSVNKPHDSSSSSNQDVHEDHIDEENQVAVFSSEGVVNMDSELRRTTAVAQDKSLNTKLSELSKDLNAMRESHALTDNDKIHQDNVKKGRDKYKTLNLIRKGNTKSRVNEFEAM